MGPDDALWLISDGKAGDLAQLQGIAAALPAAPIVKTLRPRPLFALTMPWFGVDPREHPARGGGPLSAPHPEIAIATGRRTVTALRALKRVSPRTFTVFLKDPRIDPAAFDLVWAPAHDGLAGPNVVTTVTSPHPHAPAALEAARRSPDPRLAALPRPLVGVLVGGASKDVRFTDEDARALVDGLSKLRRDAGAGLVVTLSRRTPAAARERLAALAAEGGVFLWTGEGDNPYRAMLAGCDAFVVTADSANMVGEAAASGRPIMVFRPAGVAPKLERFLAALGEKAMLTRFDGRLASGAYDPIDSTAGIAAEILARYARFRRGGGRDEPPGESRPCMNA